MTKRFAVAKLAAGMLVLAPAAAAGHAFQAGEFAIEQLHAKGTPIVEQVSPDARPPAPVRQLAPTNPGASSPAQLAAPGGGEAPVRQMATSAQGRAPTPQLATRDTNPRVVAVPPWLRDACDEAARGRRPPPNGVDCASVMEAVARTPPPPSAEEVLLATDEERATRRSAVEAGRALAPDAEEVARRVSTGDLQNAPVAQAVAAAFQARAAQTPAPAAQTPIIIPGGSGPVVITPPQGNQ